MISATPSLRYLRLVVTSLMLVLLSACGVQDYSEYRFRMTVEVDTPEGLRTGSSVYQVSAWNTGSMLPDASKRGWKVQGDAVAVDLPSGQALFALLKTGAIHGDLAGLSMTALDPSFNNDVVESAARLASRTRVQKPAVVQPEIYPMLVTFRDISDPMTVEQVNASHLDTNFGKGVRLKRITVQLTDDPVTMDIERSLPWLPNVYALLDKEDFHPAGIPVGDYRGLFTTKNFN